MEEARDVIDMLSLEPDPVKRDDATVSDANTYVTKEILTALKRLTMSVIDTSLTEEAESSSSWKDITTQGRPRFFQRLVLAVLSLSMMQLSGINLITYYA